MAATRFYGVFSRELTECVMPYVRDNFRTIEEKESRAIAGFSRGGGQSLFCALSHPELFSWVASFSAYLTPEMMDSCFPWYSSDPTLVNKDFKLLWYGVGSEDFLYGGVTENLRYLDSKGIRYKSITTDGGHTWMNARKYLTETLQSLFK